MSPPPGTIWPQDDGVGAHMGRNGEHASDGVRLAEEVAELWRDLVAAGSAYAVEQAVTRLTKYPQDVAAAHIEGEFGDLIAHRWVCGWQPLELLREVRRRTNARITRLVEIAVHADHATRAGQSIDPRWTEQVRSLGQRDVSLRDGWLIAWCAREGRTRLEGYLDLVQALFVIKYLPRLELLIPRPGGSPSEVKVAAPSKASAAHPMLDRVRKLLAKAEATEFEAEASAFTAKAQELMTRYAIDSVQLEESDSDIKMIRVPVDAPYVDAKSALLNCVATANRSKALLISRLDLCTLIGHGDDLAAVEMLFTSLLVQAQNALAHAGHRSEARTRSATFRASFYLGFAARIGERLQSANEEAEVGGGEGVLVLRRREDAVKDVVDDLYGDTLGTAGVRGGYDYAGHIAGRVAADEARLGVGEVTER